MHPLFLLAFATFLLVVAFACWSYFSTRAHEKSGGRGTKSGLGGPNDPLS